MKVGLAAMIALATVCGVSAGAPGSVVIVKPGVDNTPRVTNIGSHGGERNLAQLEAWSRKRRRSKQRKRGRR